MYFQLLKLILWPRIAGAPRVLEFTAGFVNVISGASKTGKSAVIPIIDYCLCADKCAIPVGVIRESCSWFGVLIETVEGQKLLARREPGDVQKTGDMVLIEGPIVDVPPIIEQKNTNADIVKAMLNRLAGLTNLGFDPSSEGAYKARPSFRDLMAFTFQPQNIVANPDVMFYKADTTEHRDKLKTIFPYLLGAVTAQTLQARFEIGRLSAILQRKEADLRAFSAGGVAWRLEAQAWIRPAIELGLLPSNQVIPTNWADVVDLLKRVVDFNARAAAPSLAGIDVVLTRLRILRAEESMVAAKLIEHRQRLNELRRLLESSEAYGEAIRIQRDRLGIADWMRGLMESRAGEDAISSLGDGGRDRLSILCDNLSALEVRLRTHPSISDTFDKEVLRCRAAADVELVRLNEIRQELSVLEKDSQVASSELEQFDRVERFLGRLQEALRLYSFTDQATELSQELEALRARIRSLQLQVAESEIQRKLRNALAVVEGFASALIPRLDAEWPDAPIRLMINDLTLKVIRGGRDDYLWEIGSGGLTGSPTTLR